MPKEAFYFSHDSNSRSDEKILKLRLKHGWEGYGIYWALIEMLRDSSTYELECDLDLIAFELRCDKDKIKSIIFDFNLFIISGSNFFSHSLKRRMELKEAKSEQARDAARTRWAKRKKSNSNADALQKQSNSNAIKEKKEKKENEIHSKNPNEQPPTIEQVKAYFQQRQVSAIEANAFFDFWGASNWCNDLGKNVNWQQKAISWISRMDKKQKEQLKDPYAHLRK